MVNPDPAHQLACQTLIRLDPAKAKERIRIQEFRASDYVATEVLAAIVRARYGKDSGVLDAAAHALYQRLLRLAGAFLRKNGEWRQVENASSETLPDMTSYTLEKLLTDSSAVCFAEVRFLPYAEARFEDYLRSQLALKNQMPSIDEMDAREADDSGCSLLERIEDPSLDTPEIAAIRAQTSDRLNYALLSLPAQERRAIYMRIQCDMGWSETAKALGCSIPTAEKHLKNGLEKLQGVQV